jgi:hypothetical protein
LSFSSGPRRTPKPVVQRDFYSQLRKLDPEKLISFQALPFGYWRACVIHIAGIDIHIPAMFIHIPGMSIHIPGIHIHIIP